MRWQTLFRRMALLLLSMAFTPGSHAQAELIPNGTFDSNVDGWTAWPLSTGEIEWTADQGQPPGALKIVGEDQVAILLGCFHFVPGVIYFTADAFMETSGEFVNCSLNFFMYSDEVDCTGNFGIFPIVDDESIGPNVENPNEWEHLVMEVGIPDNPADTGVRSFRPIMIKSLDTMGDDACIFDNASLRIERRLVAAIPALSPAGFTFFGVLLALTAIAVLRKASRA